MGLWRRLDGTGVPLLLARLLVGVLFVRMGLAKVDDPVAFLKLVRQYELAPDAVPWMLNSLAIVIPWLEIWLGGLLLLGVAVRGTSLVLIALLLVFSAAIAQRAWQLSATGSLPLCQVAFDCGCGSGVVVACSKLWENLGLTVAAGVALASRSRRFCLAPRLLGRGQPMSG